MKVEEYGENDGDSRMERTRRTVEFISGEMRDFEKLTASRATGPAEYSDIIEPSDKIQRFRPDFEFATKFQGPHDPFQHSAGRSHIYTSIYVIFIPSLCIWNKRQSRGLRGFRLTCFSSGGHAFS